MAPVNTTLSMSFARRRLPSANALGGDPGDGPVVSVVAGRRHQLAVASN